nr:29 kDa ribonucleoprotein A, chloroplastic-like [Tanacetum cinerariifolium]
MTSSATSLHFLTLSSVTKTQFSVTKTPTPSSLTFSPSFKLISHLHSKPISKNLFEPTPSSRIVRNVAVSSGLELADDDGEELSGDDEQQSFSPDLKLFVGNLPFSVDSAALAGLFEAAGNVEMVEGDLVY